VATSARIMLMPNCAPYRILQDVSRSVRGACEYSGSSLEVVLPPAWCAQLPSEVVHASIAQFTALQTTASKATWTPALGAHAGSNRGAAPSHAFSGRDLPSHLQLKERKPGQNTLAEVRQIYNGASNQYDFSCIVPAHDESVCRCTSCRSAT
jgi:hypothetical protein